MTKTYVLVRETRDDTLLYFKSLALRLKRPRRSFERWPWVVCRRAANAR